MRSKPAIGLLVASGVGLLWLSWTIRQHDHAVPAAPSYVVAGLWIVSLAVLLWRAVTLDRQTPRVPRRPLATWLADPQVTAAASLLILGFIFRSTELDALPWGYAGLHIDGAYNSEIAFRILDGRQGFSPVFESLAYPRDALTHYYLAAFFAVGGRTVETLRFACNVLALFDCALLFVILRNYTSSPLVVLGTAALYVFSSVDTVFAMSAMEYIMTTPFILGSFVLFERARRLGTRGAAVLAGLVWGLGLSSHYPYLLLAPILPVIALFNLASTRRWLGLFLLAGLAAAMPKLTYLVFNSHLYFLRFVEVSRHDAGAHFLVWDYFVQAAPRVAALLFESQMGFKYLLPEGPVIPRLQVPLLAIGLATAAVRLRRPEHMLAVAVTTFTVLVNFGAFVADYRVMNAMPIFFLLTGIGLRQCERFLGDGWPSRLAVGTAVGALLIASVSAYFSHADTPEMSADYGTDEVALARRVAAVTTSGDVYLVAPLLTYRTVFFNLGSRDIASPNTGLDGEAQLHYSPTSAARVLTNVEELLRRSAASNKAANFVLSEASPYAATVQRYLTTRGGARLETLPVTDPVSHRTSIYRVVRVAVPATVLSSLDQDGTLFRSSSRVPPDASVGTLSLETFGDPDQVVLVDEREVPAILDFDFVKTAPYAATWIAPFSLRWSGYLRVEATGDYRLEVTCDDGCRLFLDDQLLLTDWNIGAARTLSGAARLEEGWHRLRIDYFQQANEARFAFRMGRMPNAAEAVKTSGFANDLGVTVGSTGPAAVVWEGARLIERGQCDRARRYLEAMAPTLSAAELR